MVDKTLPEIWKSFLSILIIISEGTPSLMNDMLLRNMIYRLNAEMIDHPQPQSTRLSTGQLTCFG